MKAYGFPLTEDRDNCFGVCVDENWKFLGSHISSNYSWLSRDLKLKCGSEYEYSFIDKMPNKDMVIMSLISEIYRLNNEK